MAFFVDAAVARLVIDMQDIDHWIV